VNDRYVYFAVNGDHVRTVLAPPGAETLYYDFKRGNGHLKEINPTQAEINAANLQAGERLLVLSVSPYVPTKEGI
jgi:hypothetical protein